MGIRSLLATTSALLASCMAINGTGNTVRYADFPPASTFAIQQLGGDPIIGAKIQRMLVYQLERKGLRAVTSAPDVLVSFAFDVTLANISTTAYTAIRQAPQSAYVYGNTVMANQSRATATTLIDTTHEYQKTIAVRISRATNGEKLWDGMVTERGWCNQIFVTTPQILALMFSGFPKEQTNLQKVVTDTDEAAKELRRVFPPETSWVCLPT